MTRIAWLPVLVIAALVGAAAGRPSPVIYPEQRLPLAFSHAAHLARDVGCTDCHTAAATSRSAIDNLVPAEAACRSCHAIDRASQQGCELCHVGFVPGEPPARVYVPPPNLKFDHARHVERGMACTACHEGVPAAGLATRDHLPRMARCLECHDGAQAPDACDTCHLAEVGVLRTELPHGTLAPSGAIFGDAHDLDFVEHHGAAATRNPDYCGSCHREAECADCHAGVVKPADFHPGDYELTHVVDARRNDPDCSTCHRKQTFCVGCHERSGVGTRVERGYDATLGAPFHPAGWETRHGREARANLDACASCHREDDCRACHTAELGTPRVSPHGAGWRGSRRCEALAEKNPRMCLRCHVEGAPDCGGL